MQKQKTAALYGHLGCSREDCVFRSHAAIFFGAHHPVMIAQLA
jgi:hypothetical protein